MREGLTVTGLTTASTIWVTAAIGMAVGAGEYGVSIVTTAIVIVVLTVFGFIQGMLERFRKSIELHITISGENDAAGRRDGSIQVKICKNPNHQTGG